MPYDSAKQLLQRAFELLYTDSINLYGVHDNALAVEAINRAVIATSARSSTGAKTFIWDNRLLEAAKSMSDPYYSIISKRTYSLYLNGRQEFQKSISVLEGFYLLLPRMQEMPVRARRPVIRGCCKLASDIVEYGEQEGTRDLSPQNYLVRAREVREATVEPALKHLGPKDAETIQAIMDLAEFNEKYGAGLKAEAQKEFVITQLEEFKLISKDSDE
jgi:hypothetical protein